MWCTAQFIERRGFGGIVGSCFFFVCDWLSSLGWDGCEGDLGADASLQQPRAWAPLCGISYALGGLPLFGFLLHVHFSSDSN